MSERYCAHIRIGGRLDSSSIDPFVAAIYNSHVSLDWGEPPFEPSTTDDLIEVRREGWLWFCDTEARYGEFDDLEEACRELGLAYCRFCEAWCGYDAELVDWRAGMAEPLIRTCSNDDSKIILVDAAEARDALAALEAGRTQEAVAALRSLCPSVADLPPFEII